MKKFFTLLVLATMAASWTGMSARWIVGERKNASQIHAGDTVVLQLAYRQLYSDRYLQIADENYPDLDLMIAPGLGVGSAAVITFEEGPNDIRTDAPTLYIKMVANGKYIANKYYNWYDKGMELTDNIDQAAPFQVLNCGEEIPWYDETADNPERRRWNREDDAIWDDNSVGFSVSPSETTFAYLSFWNYSKTIPRAITWSYSSGNQWNAYAVTYEEDLREDLQKLIDAYTADAEYIGGTDPGFYTQDKVEAYEGVLENALLISYDPSSSDELLRSTYDDLKAARLDMMASLIPMQEGYYYIINDDENIANNGVTPKAMFINEISNNYYYGPFDENDIKFVYKVSPREDGFWDVQNLKSDYMLGIATEFTGLFTATNDRSYYTKLTCWQGSGSWYIETHNGTRFWAMTARNNPAEADETVGQVYAYNGAEVTNAPHLRWGWRFQRLTDEQMAKFQNEKEQVDRTAELRELVSEANDIYAKLFNYTVGDEGLVKVVNGGAYEAPTDESQIRFGTARGDGTNYLYMAGKYEYLIDEYDSTYIKCGDYIDIDVKTPVQTVTFKWETRCASMKYGTANQHKWGVEERPNQIEIYASNDTVGGNWTKVGGNTFGGVTDEERTNPFPPVVYTLDMGEPYRYIRYAVISNASGGTSATLAAFQVYGSVIDETTSQYYTTEGLKDKADALDAQAKASAAIVEANTATDEDIQTMKSALAAVKELYADTTALAALISECEVLLDGVQVGDGMGQLSDESLKTNLEQAISDARNNAFAIPVSASAVKAAEAAIKEAKTAFMAGLKTFEEGKWYFITNLDTERTGAETDDDAYCYGSAIYLNSKRPGSSVTKWGLFDMGSMSLNADGNPKAMWRFVPVEGTGYYAIQNMYNAYYLGDFAGENINLPISETPVPYNIAYVGNAKFTLTPMTASNKTGANLWPEGAANDVVCHAPGTPASAWTFVEAVPEEQQAISISDFPMNYIDVMALPYNISDIATYNDDVHTYAVRKITQEMDGEETVTTVELYEKNEFAAGEPCIIVLGDTATDKEMEDFDLIIPFPSEMLDHSSTFVSNGILGALHDLKCGDGTAICSDGKHFTAVVGEGHGFGAQTGVIDLSTYKGEVAGQETAYTLVIRGMAQLSNATGDVDGDGNVNTADVVAAYAFIIQGEESGFTDKAADVNGDGDVNSADVVAIYAAIIGPVSTVLETADVMPEYPGGGEACAKFVSKNLRYPIESVNNNATGLELVRFVVNEDGTIGNIEILESVDQYCDAEIIRIVKLLPNFTPGQQDGKPVKVWYTIPVNFNIEAMPQ